MKEKTYNSFLLYILFVFLPYSAVSQSKKEEWPVPPEADKLENPIGGLQSNESSKKIYEANCLPCHGAKGKGDGPAGISLDPRPYDLTGKKARSETDGAIYWRISNGHLTMPTFGSTLTTLQRWQMVNYLRSLQQAAGGEKTKNK